MTSYQVGEDQELANALSDVLRRLDDHGAFTAACELRSAASVGNGYHVAHVPHGAVRGALAAGIRATAEGHPARAKLLSLANGLDPAPAVSDPVPEAAVPVPE